MKSYSATLAVIGLLFLSACDDSGGSSALVNPGTGPGASGAYRAGTTACSYQFINDYNDVTSTLRRTRTLDDLDSSESAVDQFATKYAGVVCKAELDGVETSIDASSKSAQWKKVIVAARDAARSPNPVASANPTHVDPPVIVNPSTGPSRETEVASLSSGITIEVRDSATFNRLATAGVSLLIQGGAMVAATGADQYGNFCYFQKTGTSRYVTGDTIEFPYIQERGRNLAAVSSDRTVDMGCAKLDSSASNWKLKDLDAVLGSVAAVHVPAAR